ncbi:hypothetical protein ZWY2020_044722 [Hordeum vulgare]|nr:hypothetical protein ZWY2020_044722 [Hordeum vulgare]
MRQELAEQKRANTAAAVATLPDDVVLEILARVADDVAALFRCAVSFRRWGALVADPSFLRRRWPEGARHPCPLLGIFYDVWISGPPGFTPEPGSLLGPSRRPLGSFFPRSAGLFEFDHAIPLVSRSGLLLVRIGSHGYPKQAPVRLALCNPLAGRCEQLPPLEHDVFSGMTTRNCAILSFYLIKTIVQTYDDDKHCQATQHSSR